MSDFAKNEIAHRYFYHLRYTGNPPECWRHMELYPSEGGQNERDNTFDFFWADLPNGVPELHADHGIMLPILNNNLKLLSERD
jgi:hypothetical protein